jgi:uncharacterized protein
MDQNETQTRYDPISEVLPVSRYLNRLREHRDDLMERYGIRSLGVFGSCVRNEQHEGSDVDVLVSFTSPPGLLKLVELQEELSELLGTPVDLVVRSELKPHIGRRILAEVVEV